MALTEAEVKAQQAREEALKAGRQARMEAMQFAQQVEDVFGVPRLVQKLEEYPEMIRHQQEAIKAADQCVQEAREELEYQEAVLKTQIATAVNPDTGKAAYSNEEARKAEFICRARLTQGYQAAAQALKAAEGALQLARFEHDYLLNEFGAARAQSRVVAGRLGLLGRN